MFEKWGVWDEVCSRCRKFSMWHVWDTGCLAVGCFGYAMFGMWVVLDVRYLGCEMFRIWNVWEVGCGMFRMWDGECEMFAGMCDADFKKFLKIGKLEIGSGKYRQ